MILKSLAIFSWILVLNELCNIELLGKALICLSLGMNDVMYGIDVKMVALGFLNVCTSCMLKSFAM